MRNECLDTAARLVFVALFSICLAQATTFAQQPDAMNPARPMPISLSQAIEMALRNNKDIALARQNVLTADWDLEGVRGLYETRSTFSSLYEHASVPVNSYLSGGVNGSVTHSDLLAGYRLEGFAPKGGGTYEMSFSSRRFTTNNLFAALNPQYGSELLFQYTQPLGRGRRFSTRFKDIEVAKTNSELSDTQFRKIVTETVFTVKRAYWDLVFARNNLSIQTEVLRDSQSQLDLSRRRARIGLVAATDVVRPEARAAESERSVYRALEEVTRAENILKNLIVDTSSSQLWSVSLAPTETLDSDAPAMTLEASLTAALNDRLELQEMDVVRKINDIEQRYYRDQTRPQVDLVGSYGLTGVGGSFVKSDDPSIAPFAQVPLPGFLEGSYGQSLSNLAQNRFSSVRVGVQITLPFHNRTAEAKMGRAVVEGQRLNTQREKLKQLIQMDVRNAYQAVYAAESRRRAAAVVRVSMEQQYASEQRKSSVGYSTNDVVLDRHVALAAARVNELNTQTERNKALVELERAMGTALEANGIAVRSQ